MVDPEGETTVSSDDVSEATPKAVWQLRIGLWATVAILLVVILLTVGVFFEWPTSAVVTGTIAVIACAVATFITAYRDKFGEISRGFLRTLITFAAVVSVMCMVITVAVLTTRARNKPPIFSTSMTPLALDSAAPPDTTDGRPWNLVVPDSHLLPNLPPISPPAPVGPGCADLWRAAVEAGGQVPTAATFKVQIWGNAVATIVDMRAQILRHLPASDGTFVECVPFKLGPPVPDQPVSCDLTQPLDVDQSAACTVKNSDGKVILLRNVETIPLQPNGESAGLQVSVRFPPGDAVEWHLQARVTTPGGENKWINLGKPVTSPGFRDIKAHPYQREIANFGLATIIWSPGDPSSPPIPAPLPGSPSGTPHP